MSIGAVQFDATNIPFTKGRFGCWLFINSITAESTDFYLFGIADFTFSHGITFSVTYLPSTPTLTFWVIDDVGNYVTYEDPLPISLDTWYFIELSWNHTGTPEYHVYIDSVERSMNLIDSMGTPVVSGISDLLAMGFLGGVGNVIDVRTQNILFSNLDTRDLYALRGDPTIEQDILFWRFDSNDGSFLLEEPEDHNPYGLSINNYNNAETDITHQQVGNSGLGQNGVSWGQYWGIETNNILEGIPDFLDHGQISFWLNYISGPSGAEYTIVQDYQGSDPGNGFRLYFNATGVVSSIILKCNNLSIVGLTGPAPSGVHHYIIKWTWPTFDLYFDGVNVMTSTATYPMTMSGSSLYWGNTFGNPAQTCMDNLFITLDTSKDLYAHRFDTKYNVIPPYPDLYFYWGGENDTTQIIIRPEDKIPTSSTSWWTSTTPETAWSDSIYEVGSGSLALPCTLGVGEGVEFTLSPTVSLLKGRTGRWIYIPSNYTSKWTSNHFQFKNTISSIYFQSSVRFIPYYGFTMQLWISSGGGYANSMAYSMSVSPGWHFFEWAWDCSVYNNEVVYYYLDGVNVPINYPGLGYETLVFRTWQPYFAFTPISLAMYTVGESTPCDLTYYIDNILHTTDYTRDLYAISHINSIL